jgi:hypothetical protein
VVVRLLVLLLLLAMLLVVVLVLPVVLVLLLLRGCQIHQQQSALHCMRPLLLSLALLPARC